MVKRLCRGEEISYVLDYVEAVHDAQDVSGVSTRIYLFNVDLSLPIIVVHSVSPDDVRIRSICSLF